MATSAKKKGKKNPEKKTNKSDTKAFRPEKEEKINLKMIARDERTWKIIGAFFLLIALFLFISFISYLFTWKEDQAKVFSGGFSILFDGKVHTSNLLGKLGALVSHLFIFKGFGLASFLICTFFFVVGVNLLFRQKVFSIWRNLKYVTLGLVVLSVSLAFIAGNSNFSFGGAVGNMISDKLTGALGNIGTAAALLLLAGGYCIWQFNPSFNLPNKKQNEVENEDKEITEEIIPVTTGRSINDLYAEKKEDGQVGNSIKTDSGMVINFPDEQPLHDFKVIEKDEPPEDQTAREDSFGEKIEKKQPTVENEIVKDLMHSYDTNEAIELTKEEIILPVKPTLSKKEKEDLELEIKELPAKIEEEEVVVGENQQPLAPYEPTLDLRDYKYPTLDLLETHGSEKIFQDVNELENNKNQIIATLRNYAIEIQKISATVGPTVTLYEIVPAPGIRISKIKNLEDDIALSLAALGIRIIAPIPGKGTIGIEVPNVKKTIVSMKTLLASEKFQNNNFSLPIAIGKKIDNDNFIVDLASMPHLLMAGATGQGKSVGLNAILVSLLYKKHPSQLKLVLVDPKKVELSLYRVIEKHFLAKLPGEDEAIITDTKKVVHTLNALCIEMDNRYDLLKEAGARNIKEYNEKFVKTKTQPAKRSPVFAIHCFSCRRVCRPDHDGG